MADSDHSVNIKITGDSSGAVSSIGKVKNALTGVMIAIRGVTRALGFIHLAINGIQTIIKGFQWLKEKATEAAREIAKLKWDLEMRNAANETARLVGWHEKLAKLMKDELDTLSKQRAVAALEQQGKQDYEDGRREAERARQIYEAKSTEEEQALRDRFAAEDEQRARDERKAQRKQQIETLDAEESVFSSKARSLKENNADIDKQIKDERFNRVRAVKDEDKESIDKRIAALEQRKKANEAEIAQFEKEAKFRRDQIAALENQKDYEGPSAGEWQRKTEAKKRAEETAKQEAEAKEKAEKESGREAARAAEARQNEENRQKLDRANDLSGFADRLSAVEGVSQNRLTAMGLSSGVSGSGGMASDVKKLVDLLKQEVEATKNIKVDGDSTAVYGD